MRFLFTLLITACVGALLYLDDPSWVTVVGRYVSAVDEGLLAGKDVRIEGLSTLSRTEIERVLPVEKSVPWWMANRRAVEARITENPRVQSAKVESCPGGWLAEWGCFVVSVTERKARYVGSVDDKVWLISDDGAFMRPIEAGEQGSLGIEGLVRLSGLASQSNSPDVLRHQLAVVRDSAARLEGSVGRGIVRIGFEGRSDLPVWFQGFDFPVVFGVAPESGVPLEEQAERLRALLAQLGARVSEVSRIDLAFSKVGSVTLKTGPEGLAVSR